MNDASPGATWEQETFAYSRLHTRLMIIARHLAALRPASVLELGCGIGVLRQALLADAEPALSYWGCDISQAAVDQIGDPQVVQCDFNRQDIPFADRSFECIVASGVLEYIDDLSGFAAQLQSRIVPGGHLVVSYFNMRHVYRRMQRLAGRSPYRHLDWRNDESPASFVGLLEAAGFAVIGREAVSTGVRPPPAAVEQLSPVSARARASWYLDIFAHTVVYVCSRRGGER